ncbi:hypothetical protein C1J05_16045 [Sulfitobacter sp. JL08]|nr:hypothetical protein C1J05_16045 [Sulfitobacter sp. JL08]
MLGQGERQVIEEKDLSEKAASLQAELQRAFGVKATTLAKALRKTGRRLPASLAEKAEAILQAQSYGGHPKLMRMVDPGEVEKAHSDIMAYLGEIDPSEARRNRLLNLTAEIALKLLFIISMVVLVLVWRDLI